jgi:hypothetical protein
MKILKTTLKEMLKMGQIGELKPKLERSQVREIMGNPETWDAVDEASSGIWKYGILEYSFGIPYIALEIHSRSDKLPQNIQIAGFFPNNNTSLKEFEEFLEANQLQASVDSFLSYGRQITLNIGKGSVGFMDNQIHAIFLKSQ